MPVICHLNDLETEDLILEGCLPSEELALEGLDELMRFPEPLHYRLTAQKTPQGLLVQGELWMVLDCECARCLTPFVSRIELTDWACLLPWEGEDQVAIINDAVDLTPYLREDIVLAFPQHPLCKADCPGLAKLPEKTQNPSGQPGSSGSTSTPWAALDKLKF